MAEVPSVGGDGVDYVVMPRPWDDQEQPGRWAADREAEGWDGLGVGDHWFLEGSGGCLHPFVALGAAAALTSSIRLTTCFANNLFRSPVELAQAGLTLQHVSRGRFELGVGAGWAARELTGAGLPFPDPGSRVRRLREAVIVIRQLLQGPCQFDGEFYQVDLPAVGPRLANPPLLTAALGGPISIRTVGPLVDRIELATMGVAFREGTSDMAAYGSRSRHELQQLVDDARTANPGAALGLSLYVAAGAGRGVEAFTNLFRGGCYEGLAGEPARVAEAIRSFADLGVDRITVMPPFAGTVEALAPHLITRA